METYNTSDNTAKSRSLNRTMQYGNTRMDKVIEDKEID